MREERARALFGCVEELACLWGVETGARNYWGMKRHGSCVQRLAVLVSDDDRPRFARLARGQQNKLGTPLGSPQKVICYQLDHRFS